jgi:hypothetical protein
MKGLSVRCAAVLCVLASVTVAAVEVWAPARHVRTQDQNGDGRPDVWRHYDNRGLLIEVAVDSNFDGRPDVEEYYDRGALVRRESDRDFNGQADLVEDFDVETHAQTRSVVDIDYDGTADLLVLFRDGLPVFSERTYSRKSSTTPTSSSPAVHNRGSHHLAALSDPFASDVSVRAVHLIPNADGSVGLSTSGGLPRPRRSVVERLSASASVAAGDIAPRALTFLPRCSPRAPPVSPL